MTYKIIVLTDAGTEVEHYYGHESDARFQLAEWQGQGVTCKLIIPPTTVFIAWTTDVTERYRSTVNTVDLPESVQAALAEGATILSIAKGLDEAHAQALEDLDDYLSTWEDAPYDEDVTERGLDVSTMERQAKQ